MFASTWHQKCKKDEKIDVDKKLKFCHFLKSDKSWKKWKLMKNVKKWKNDEKSEKMAFFEK